MEYVCNSVFMYTLKSRCNVKLNSYCMLKVVHQTIESFLVFNFGVEKLVIRTFVKECRLIYSL